VGRLESEAILGQRPASIPTAAGAARDILVGIAFLDGNATRRDKGTQLISPGANGYLESLTDALDRTVTFDQYDGAGRVKQETLPGNRVLLFDYDENGNLRSLTPPGRPVHAFTYTAVDLLHEYVPPVVPLDVRPMVDLTGNAQLKLAPPSGFSSGRWLSSTCDCPSRSGGLSFGPSRLRGTIWLPLGLWC